MERQEKCNLKNTILKQYSETLYADISFLPASFFNCKLKEKQHYPAEEMVVPAL